MSAPNVLLLDEPTNDLDIETLCILENYLDTFAGAVITVSHDRHFIDRIAKHTFVYEGDGKIGHYMGGYTDWAETKAALEEERAEIAKAKSASNSSSTSNDTRAEKQKKLKFTFKEQKEFETIDEDIANLEAEIEEVDTEINKCGSDFGKLQKLTAKRDELTLALDEKMERWVYLNDLAEQIEAQKK